MLYRRDEEVRLLQDQLSTLLVDFQLLKGTFEHFTEDHCQEHGIFLAFSLLFFTTFYVVLPLSTLFSQFHSSRKDNMRAIDPIT